MWGVKALITALFVVSVVAACGSDGEVPELEGEPERGRQIAADNGCAVCHGQHGQGGAASGFFGLWGSDVELSDGTFVVADAEYLRRAIVDPDAEIVAGSRLEMPTVELTEEEVDAMLVWIEALADR
jgi:cytochrome c oxidase subunit 2